MKIVDQILDSPRKTLLCVGPLSTNIIDSCIEISNKENIPIVLIASRRQIDSAELGRGYVNNWSTQEFVEYVRSKQSQNIFLARDHGGPWQGNIEIKKQMNEAESMATAKKSFEADIDAGMQYLHIDPSVPIGNETLEFETIVSRLFELYGHVCEYSQSKGKKIRIELGTEEQNGSLPNSVAFEDFLKQVQSFCKSHHFQEPQFVVVQTGTKVIESRNVGVFEQQVPQSRANTIRSIKKSSEIARKYGIFVKEHNADYLTTENLALRPFIGIKGSNVAPEFGLLETKTLIHLLRTYESERDYNDFVRIVLSSEKWKKWMSPDTNTTLSEKTMIAGHYCYSDPAVIEIKARLRTHLTKQGIELDDYLKSAVRAGIYRYATAFGLV